MRANLIVPLVAILGGIACGSSAEGIGGRPNPGVGGSGATRPECGALNQGCMGHGLDAPIALGSTLEITLDYQIAGSSGPPTTIEVGSTAVLERASDARVTAVGEGLTALLFVGPDQAAVDFLHVWVQRAEELRIQRYAQNGTPIGPVQDSVKLLVGDEILIAVETYGKGQALLGSFALSHTATGKQVAVVPDPVGGFYRIVAREPGMTTLTFEALGLKKVWDIEVLP